MKLFHSQTSPYVRKVMVVLHETDQLDAIELRPAGGSPMAPAQGLPAANPLGKVPALERDEGPTLYDSRVICRYLDARAEAGLYPNGPRLWDALTLEATADGILDAALLMVYETRLRPETHQSEDWIEAQWNKVSQAVTAINSRWMSHLAGPLDIGQIAVGCALGYLDLRHSARHWRQGNGALDDWFAVFAERQSMKETRPE